MEALIDKLEGPRILVVRGLRVILDEDLARLYGVTTKALNQAVRRNPRRFPAAFVISVANEDLTNLKSQNVTSSFAWGGRRKPAFAFTEHGALMVASVLNSDRAIAMSVYVIKAFVKMREELMANENILRRLSEIGPRTPAPGPCQSRLRLLGECAYAPALTAPCWCTTRA
jgi:hypothetical protein